ncbi:MAG: hypothetical protein LBI79_02570 [Nitrososphaerota archaeon]|jgi:hypothetical protein|nr:hypothetical protein [Nitrososphaerota archaeon]
MAIQTATLKKNLPAFFMLAVAVLIPLFALWSGFCSVDLVGNKEGLAILLATMTFPLTGVMIFVLTQALKLRGDYNQFGMVVKSKVTWYTVMCWASALTIVECVTTGLISLRYITTGATADVLLVGALCLVMSISILLVFNVLLFFMYTLNGREI